MPRTIDGFVPRTAVTRRPQPIYTKRPALSATAHMPPAQQQAPVITPVPAVVAPQQPAPPAAVPTHALPKRYTYAQPAPPKSNRRTFPARLQLPVVIMGAMLAGIFAQSAIFGEVLVVAYGIAGLIWNIPSRTTFTLALLSMVATTLLLVVRGNIPLAQNFATYTFLLLVVGVITLTRELKKEGGRIYSSRKNIS